MLKGFVSLYYGDDDAFRLKIEDYNKELFDSYENRTGLSRYIMNQVYYFIKNDPNADEADFTRHINYFYKTYLKFLRDPVLYSYEGGKRNELTKLNQIKNIGFMGFLDSYRYFRIYLKNDKELTECKINYDNLKIMNQYHSNQVKDIEKTFNINFYNWLKKRIMSGEDINTDQLENELNNKLSHALDENSKNPQILIYSANHKTNTKEYWDAIDCYLVLSRHYDKDTYNNYLNLLKNNNTLRVRINSVYYDIIGYKRTESENVIKIFVICIRKDIKFLDLDLGMTDSE